MIYLVWTVIFDTWNKIFREQGGVCDLLKGG
jgi:hypothetical protein